MIKHIVMFRLKEFAEGADKKENMRKINEILEKLPSKIKEIRQYEIHQNITQSERSADFILISSFENKEDLDIYLNHPDHRKAADFISKIREDSRVIDYEY